MARYTSTPTAATETCARRPPATRPQTDHDQSSEHELASTEGHRIILLAILLDQPRTHRAGQHGDHQKALADQAHPATEARAIPIDQHNAQHAEHAAQPFARVHALCFENPAGDEHGHERIEPLNDRTLYALRVRYANVEKDILGDRLHESEPGHIAPASALGQHNTPTADADKNDRKQSRQKKPAPRKQDLRSGLATLDAEKPVTVLIIGMALPQSRLQSPARSTTASGWVRFHDLPAVLTDPRCSCM